MHWIDNNVVSTTEISITRAERRWTATQTHTSIRTMTVVADVVVDIRRSFT